MNKVKYFFQFFIILILLIVFKIIGIKFARIFAGYIFKKLGPIFRSNSLANQNLEKAIKNINENERIKIIENMWINYGKIFSEYVFLNNFNNSPKFLSKISINNLHILEEIKNSNEPVIFISGHFSNFELMAMQIEKYGVKLATIYRPLNNNFLNPIMESIRKKYICKTQIKKGIGGTKKLLKLFKEKTSIALMIDQRVTEGLRVKFFNHYASTTTIPAQFVLKFGAKIVPVYIERKCNDNFSIKFDKPLTFDKTHNLTSITLQLNKILEEMIIANPEQWIWTHNRWK